MKLFFSFRFIFLLSVCCFNLSVESATSDNEDLLGESLVSACQYNEIDLVNDLIEQGANVNHVRPDDKVTPLITAAGSGHYKIVKSLLEHDADVNFKDQLGRTAFLADSTGGYVKVLQLLLEHGIDAKSKFTALLSACANEKIKVVELLLKETDIDCNIADAFGETPLIRASSLGYYKIVEVLLRHGNVNVNLVDGNGWTALMYAAIYGHYVVADILLRRPDLNVTAVDHTGMNAEKWTIKRGHSRIADLIHLKNKGFKN